MKRAVVLVLCLFLAGAACTSTSSAPAASINGRAVSTEDLVEELNAIQANPDYIKALESGAPNNGISVGTIPLRETMHAIGSVARPAARRRSRRSALPRIRP